MLQQGKKAGMRPFRPAPIALGNGRIARLSPAEFAAKFPSTFASATATVGGTIADTNQLKIELAMGLLPGGKLSKTVVAGATDDAIAIAQKFAKAFMDDDNFRNYGAYAYALGAVLTIKWPGLIGNFVTLSKTIISGIGTITLSNAGALSGGAGPVFPYNDYTVRYAGRRIELVAHRPLLLSADCVKELIAAKAPIV